MKIIYSLLLAGCIFLAHSCVMTKTYTREELKMKIEDDKVIVIKKNGEKIIGKRLSYPSAWSKNDSWVSIDGQKIELKDLTAYQDRRAYYIKFGNDDNHVWVKQLKRGKINLYYYDVGSRSTYFDGSKYVTERKSDTHFVFQKEGEQLLELSILGIANMLKDNTEAYRKFTSRFGDHDRRILPKQLQKAPGVLFKAIDIYNGNI